MSAAQRKRRMSLLSIALLVSLAVSIVLMLASLLNLAAGQSDRYLLMRLTLMKIASGEYENVNVMAHRTLDVVDDIDNERVRQHYEGKRSSRAAIGSAESKAPNE